MGFEMSRIIGEDGNRRYFVLFMFLFRAAETPKAIALGFPKRDAVRIPVTNSGIVGYSSAMVDPNMPWSLKGISDEAREYAKQAAETADMPVGAWLSSVIDAAAGVGTGRTEPAMGSAATRPPTATADPNPSAAEGSMIERAVQVVSDFGFEPEGPARDADLIEDPDLLQASLEALERRIATSESLTEDALAPLEKEIDRIKRRLAELRGS